MFSTLASVVKLVAFFCLIGTGFVTMFGQPPAGPPRAPGVLTSNYVKTGLFVISGAGGNSILRMSSNGLIVVDGNHAANFDELRRKINRLAEQPIRIVVNTDHYEQHTGTNAKFIEGGARVVGQQNETKLLANYNPSGAKIADPSDTFDKEQTLHFGAVEVQLLHLGNARTSADTVVYFPDLKAVALGDIYSATPDADYTAGGSILGWGKVLADVMKLDFDVAIPGVGPTVTRADVQALKAKVDSLVEHAQKLVKSGVKKESLMAGLKADDLGWTLTLSPEQVDGFYAELQRLN